MQYAVFSDDERIRKEIREILLSSLYKAGRLESKRMCYIGCNLSEDEDDEFDIDFAEDVFDIQHGSTLVIQPPCIPSFGGIRNKVNEDIERLSRCILSTHKDILNILEFKRGEENTFNEIKEEIPEVRFVEIRENMMNIQEAKSSLSSRARSDGIEDIESLLSSLSNTAEEFYSDDLNRIYSKWFDEHLCLEVYPQYKDIAEAKTSVFKRTKGNAYRELESLVGLKSAKKAIKSAIDYNKVQCLFKDNGLPVESISKHMVFTGNPGSAKTTVARLFSEIMKDNNLLETGNLIEVGRADIVDKYLGGTAPRVKKIFSMAKGNVLFIDEAYSLYDGHRGLYGDEAVNTIVQEMENHRDDTIVIFAGYPDKMEEFLNSNPGLRSRISFHINFDDYDAEELLQILKLFANKNEMKLASGVEEKMLQFFTLASTKPNFGNGRFVRNIYEMAKRKQASRIVALDKSHISKDVLSTLIPEDFEIPEKYTREEHRQIGFIS